MNFKVYESHTKASSGNDVLKNEWHSSSNLHCVSAASQFVHAKNKHSRSFGSLHSITRSPIISFSLSPFSFFFFMAEDDDDTIALLFAFTSGLLDFLQKQNKNMVKQKKRKVFFFDF